LDYILNPNIVPTTDVWYKIICKGLSQKKEKILLIFARIVENLKNWVIIANAQDKMYFACLFYSSTTQILQN